MSGAEMANKAEEVMATVLQKAMEVAEKTGDFVTDQAPDVVQQLLVWKLASAVLVAAVFLFLFAMLTRLAYRATKWDDVDGDVQAMVIVFGAVGAALCGSVGVHSAMTALQIWLAPKVYLIEYTANLIK